MDINARRRHLCKRAALISVVVGLLMFGMKISGYVITGSAAVLSDALESVVHVIATMFAFYSVLLSTRPADVSHPYGHGRIEFFSASVSATPSTVSRIENGISSKSSLPASIFEKSRMSLMIVNNA